MTKLYTSLKVSVVIPVYNEEDYLRDCLESLVAQDFKFHEIIVVNNGSTDRSPEIAKSFNNVKVIDYTAQQSILAARTAGYKAATGDIIMRIDADTVTHKDWATELLKPFANEDIVAVASLCGFYDTIFPRLTTLLLKFSYFYSNKLIIGKHPLFGSSMAFRRDVLAGALKNQSTNPAIFEDLDFTLSLPTSAKTVLIKRPLADISMRSANEGTAKAFSYMSRWPRTYSLRGNTKGVIMSYIVCLMLLPLLPIVLLGTKRHHLS